MKLILILFSTKVAFFKFEQPKNILVTFVALLKSNPLAVSNIVFPEKRLPKLVTFDVEFTKSMDFKLLLCANNESKFVAELTLNCSILSKASQL